MNEAQLHLLLNHAPILGSVFGLLTLGTGLVRKNASLIQWALIVFVGVMLVVVPAFLTGDGAEEAVEHLPAISEAVIEAHEEAAAAALWATLGLGVGAAVAIALGLRKNRYSEITIKVVFILSLLVVGLLVWTGYLGGKIRHNEFNQQAKASAHIIPELR